jgi:hypothetical protein
VLLVVSLLKDRNGVINLDLPIEGTLDDPKFSIWGVIVQIVANFFTKAATSPFALLGALGGGGANNWLPSNSRGVARLVRTWGSETPLARESAYRPARTEARRSGTRGGRHRSRRP